MTDFSTATTIPGRRIRFAVAPLALMGMLRGAGTALALCGKACTTVLAAYGRALELAYSAPYACPSQKPQVEDLDGRDPNW